MSPNRTLSFGLTLAGVALAASLAPADTVVLVPVADGTLFEPAAPKLLASSGSGDFLYCGKTTGGKLRRALVRFDFSAIPAGSTITSVSLQVVLSRAVGGPREMGMFVCLTPWGEGASDAGDPGGRGTTPEPGDVTWDHAVWPDVLWTQQGGDYVPGARSVAIADASTEAVLWASTPELVADVQAWLDNTAANYGWLVRQIDEETTTTGKRFGSRENPIPEEQPRLTVEFTPPGVVCIADFNDDGIVNSTDVSDFINQWFTDLAEGTLITDWDDNGVVNSTDVSMFINDWFASPPECTG